LNKKGMEMSINVIVTLVLGLMMFIAGMAIFSSLFSKTNITGEEVNAQLEKELLNAFDDDSPLFVYKSTITLNSDSIARFGFGIHNIYDTSKKFKIKITSLNTTAIPDTKISYLDQEYEVPAKDKKPIIFLVDSKDAGPGQFAFKINVTMKNDASGTYDQYFDPKIVYVIQK